MKIAFLTPEYPHPKTGSSGGIGTSIKNLVKGLLALNHEIYIIVYGQKEDEKFIKDGINYVRIKNVKIPSLSMYLTQKKIERIINQLNAEGKIDIVEAPDWTGISAFIQPSCPLIIRQNGSDTYFCHLDNRPVKWRNKFLEKRALQNADGLIAVSSFTGKLSKKLFNLKSNFTVIPNSIDPVDFESPTTKSSENTILYFGTLIRKKGLLELPLIFNKVYAKSPNAKLLLIGKDAGDIATGSKSTWQIMQPLFEESAFKNVSYVGSVPYSEIKYTIQQATVCVFPTFAEALPVSWLESMAMQKAIVASNIGWASDLITDGLDGFLVHPTNHDLFANKILQILGDVNLNEILGKNARIKIINQFSTLIVAQKSIKFYTKIIEKNAINRI